MVNTRGTVLHSAISRPTPEDNQNIPKNCGCIAKSINIKFHYHIQTILHIYTKYPQKLFLSNNTKYIIQRLRQAKLSSLCVSTHIMKLTRTTKFDSANKLY